MNIGFNLGSLKSLFFSWIQMRDREIIRTGDLVSAFQITPKQERELLSRLYRGGQIVRLSKGLYLAPKKLPPGGKWTPHEYQVLAKLMEAQQAQYQVGGITAFNRYGLTEQVPNLVFVYNDKISGKRKIGGIDFEFAKIPKQRLGGTSELELASGIKIKISSLPRTLVDAIYDWSRFNSLPRAYEWLKTRIKEPSQIEELADAALNFGNIGTIRRIGYSLEKMHAPRSITLRLKQALPKERKVLIPLVPTRPAKGRINKDWGIIDNYEGNK